MSFHDLSLGSPTTWAWDFGDGNDPVHGTAAPSHQYATAGSYSVTLAVSDASGTTRTLTALDYIHVSEPAAAGTIHVGDISVLRVISGVHATAHCDVTIVNALGAPVEGATVSVHYSGPTAGDLTAVTTADGVAGFISAKIKLPVHDDWDWCFTVTDVSCPGLLYAPSDNVVVTACEHDGKAAADGPALPAAFALAPPQPNPFNPQTEIVFRLPRAAPVSVKIYDLQGRTVAVLAGGNSGAGEHRVIWNAGDVASGIYFCRMEAPGFSETRKLALIR